MERRYQKTHPAPISCTVPALSWAQIAVMLLDQGQQLGRVVGPNVLQAQALLALLLRNSSRGIDSSGSGSKRDSAAGAIKTGVGPNQLLQRGGGGSRGGKGGESGGRGQGGGRG